jgi:hypothetical protein
MCSSETFRAWRETFSSGNWSAVLSAVRQIIAGKLNKNVGLTRSEWSTYRILKVTK